MNGPLPAELKFREIAGSYVHVSLDRSSLIIYSSAQMWRPYFYFLSYHVFCVIGDAEAAEGSVWEAMNFASHYKLDNLCAIFDVNRLGQSDPTMLEHDFDTYKKRTEAFGWVQWIKYQCN